MPDYQEIEIKFALDDPAAVRSRLLQLGAASQGRHFENNLRLDDADRTWRRSMLCCGCAR